MIDSVRIIKDIETQVRCIPVIFKIIHTLDDRTLPINILKELLISWSQNNEKESFYYKSHNGKLTQNGERTAAFPAYIQFLIDLGLIIRTNDFVKCSKYGSLFNQISKDVNLSQQNDFTSLEKIFFLLFIFEKDADNIILILDLLANRKGYFSQLTLREIYFDELYSRLKSKENYAQTRAKIDIIDILKKELIKEIG